MNAIVPVLPASTSSLLSSSGALSLSECAPVCRLHLFHQLALLAALSSCSCCFLAAASRSGTSMTKTQYCCAVTATICPSSVVVLTTFRNLTEGFPMSRGPSRVAGMLSVRHHLYTASRAAQAHRQTMMPMACVALVHGLSSCLSTQTDTTRCTRHECECRGSSVWYRVRDVTSCTDKDNAGGLCVLLHSSLDSHRETRPQRDAFWLRVARFRNTSRADAFAGACLQDRQSAAESSAFCCQHLS